MKRLGENQQGWDRQPDMTDLEHYLNDAGFPQAAELARAVREQGADVGQLQEALHRGKSDLPISRAPAEMEQVVRTLFGKPMDLLYRRFEVGEPATAALAMGLHGMVDRATVQRTLADLMNALEETPFPTDPQEQLRWLDRRRTTSPGAKLVDRLDNVVRAMLDGNSVLFLSGVDKALVLTTPGWEKRSIEEPKTENVVAGPREGFVESLGTNISLVRRRLRDDRLRIEDMSIGTVTGTRVALLYISGITKQSLVDEARRRLQRIRTDAVLDSAYLQEFIEDTPWTVFPQVITTERPDVVASVLLEGRVAIMVDGSPFAITAPALFNNMLQAPDDYYERFPVVFMLRLLRWTWAVVALLGPSLYVALTTYHQEMLPTQLLLTIMSSRKGVPFPAILEALGMEVAFEALREAGLRLPKPIGQTVSIIGALIIGESAVRAGIVAAPTLIMVALTGIASFMIPRYPAAIALRILRFPMLILAATFGAYGITLGVVVILAHMMSLRSFGAPYMAPMAPLLPADTGDLIVRAPQWANKKRPASMEAKDQVRQEDGLQPGPHQREETGK